MNHDDNRPTENRELNDDELDAVAGGGLVEPIVSRRGALNLGTLDKASFGKEGVLIAGTTFPRGGTD